MAAEGFPEAAKIGDSLLAQHRNLAVETGCFDRQLGKDGGYGAEARRPVVRVPSEHADLPAVHPSGDAVAIDLYFMQLGVALRRAVMRAGRAGADEVGKWVAAGHPAAG